jgi:ribosomal protein L37AE/L43A
MVRRQSMPDPPPEIAAMKYTACPICGADGMKRIKTAGVVKQWYCGACRNRSMTTVPNEQQQEIAKTVLAPWRNPYDED